MDATNASPTPVEQGSLTGNAAGTDAQTVQAAPATQAATEAPRFTQDQVDGIVRARLAEQQQKLTAKLEKTWTDKLTAALAEKDQTLEATVEQRIQDKLAEQALADTRKQVQEEYGLNDAQLARLTGATPDELKADAETLFGTLKTPQARKPPVIKAGSGADPDTTLDLANMTPAQVRELTPEQRRKLLPNLYK